MYAPEQDNVPEDVAQVLLEAAPGLFVQKPNGKLAVTNARDHEKHLEKVICEAYLWCSSVCWGLRSSDAACYLLLGPWSSDAACYLLLGPWFSDAACYLLL